MFVEIIKRGGEKMYIEFEDASKADKVLIEIPCIIYETYSKEIPSIHNIKVKVTEKGEIYYLFEYRYGRSVMNFTKEDYDKVKRIIKIDGVSIFEAFEDGNVYQYSPEDREVSLYIK